ncbi:MAG: nicotinate-nucleotide adenylyltransferase [Acidobacteriota bacterium]|nr:nicotinate-nucleotide adenylyltransferase [Acidobacteriota bacterium]
MRLALFGGSFDPIHRGHLALARAAADAFSLDTVLFAPVGWQPLKHGAGAAPYHDRLEMTRLALQDAADPRFLLSTLDAPRVDGQPNYTADTLRALRQLHPDAELFVLIGADSFQTLPQWKDAAMLPELAEWIVVSRPGFPLQPAVLHGLPWQPARVHLLPTVHEDVAATELRRRLRQGDDCTGLMEPSVLQYIRQHHLYPA